MIKGIAEDFKVPESEVQREADKINNLEKGNGNGKKVKDKKNKELPWRSSKKNVLCPKRKDGM